MKNKRLLSLALSGVMALSLAAPAFAAATNTNTEINSVYQAPNIAVTVPAKGSAIINPYGLDLKLKEIGDDGNAASGAVETKITGQKIVTAPMFISNESEMNLQVGATVTGTTTTGVSFATASAANSSVKSVYVYLQAARTTLSGEQAAITAADKSTAFAAWAPRAFSATTDVVVSASGGEIDNLVILRAAKVTPPVGGSTTPKVEYKSGSIAMVRLAGDCPTAPGTAWSAGDATATPAVPADGFTVNVAYTFTPVAAETYTLKLSGTAADIDSVKVNGQTVAWADISTDGIVLDREDATEIEVTPVAAKTCGAMTAQDNAGTPNTIANTSSPDTPSAGDAVTYTIAAGAVNKDAIVTGAIATT